MQSRIAEVISSARPEGTEPVPAPETAAAVEPLNGQASQEVLEALRQSKIFQEYSQVFTQMTGLEIKLVAAKKAEPADGFGANDGHRSCFTVAPVNVQNRMIGYLQTGLMLNEKPEPEQFDRFYRNATATEGALNREELQTAYFKAVVLPPKTQESAIKLLAILAQHLGMLGGQGNRPSRVVEPATINRARGYIQEHLTEKIYLGEVAKAVNLNCFYFCKFFKKITGLGFTEYVAQLRIEKSKALLANRERSITDVAFASGFHSLTHFNRVFKKLTGLSPTAYRARISSN